MKYSYASEQTWLFKRPNQTTWTKTHWLLLRQIWRFSWGSPSPSVGSPPGRHALGARGGSSVPHCGLSLVCSGWCYLAPQPGAWQGAPARCHSPTRRTPNRPPPVDLWPSGTGLLTERLPGADFHIFKIYTVSTYLSRIFTWCKTSSLFFARIFVIHETTPLEELVIPNHHLDLKSLS